MNSLLNLKNLNIILFLTFILGFDSYGFDGGDYEYDYVYDYDNPDYQLNSAVDQSDSAEDQFPRYQSRSVSPQHVSSYDTGAAVGRSAAVNNLYEDLLNPKLSTSEADQRVPIVEEPGRGIRVRTNGACPDQRCFNCLDSCRYLKKSRVAYNSLIQYTYLRLCSMGCKEELDCLSNNYCLPVMKENPDFFVQCSSKCNLFLMVPKIFKTGQSC